MNIAIAGVGRYLNGLEECLKENVNIVFYMDNDINKRNQERNGKKIYTFRKSIGQDVDYVIIAIMDYENMSEALQEHDFSSNQIIPFFDITFNLEEYSDIFDLEKSAQYRLVCQIGNLNRKIEIMNSDNKIFFEHYMYEIADKINKQELQLPIICSVEETCQKIIDEKVSMSRYGSGEFDIMLGIDMFYQEENEKLRERLKEVVVSNVPNHIVAIADDYGSLEELREQTQNVIRKYMTNEVRKGHYECIDLEKKYYNAYISRPYVIYPHEKIQEAKERFDKLKNIWKDQDVLLVEGCKTRMGVGNDLFSNVSSLERIIAPNENAFNVYDEILDEVLEYGKNKLILIALGPTATVLAYDLAKAGYWALDIGHVDLEYEWFLKGKGYSYIPNKYNNEMPGDDEVLELKDKEYENSIIKRIG